MLVYSAPRGVRFGEFVSTHTGLEKFMGLLWECILKGKALGKGWDFCLSVSELSMS